jgi:hypothetical protein
VNAAAVVLLGAALVALLIRRWWALTHAGGPYLLNANVSVPVGAIGGRRAPAPTRAPRGS